MQLVQSTQLNWQTNNADRSQEFLTLDLVASLLIAWSQRTHFHTKESLNRTKVLTIHTIMYKKTQFPKTKRVATFRFVFAWWDYTADFVHVHCITYDLGHFSIVRTILHLAYLVFFIFGHQRDFGLNFINWKCTIVPYKCTILSIKMYNLFYQNFTFNLNKSSPDRMFPSQALLVMLVTNMRYAMLACTS